MKLSFFSMALIALAASAAYADAPVFSRLPPPADDWTVQAEFHGAQDGRMIICRVSETRTRGHIVQVIDENGLYSAPANLNSEYKPRITWTTASGGAHEIIIDPQPGLFGATYITGHGRISPTTIAMEQIYIREGFSLMGRFPVPDTHRLQYVFDQHMPVPEGATVFFEAWAERGTAPYGNNEQQMAVRVFRTGEDYQMQFNGLEDSELFSVQATKSLDGGRELLTFQGQVPFGHTVQTETLTLEIKNDRPIQAELTEPSDRFRFALDDIYGVFRWADDFKTCAGQIRGGTEE